MPRDANSPLQLGFLIKFVEPDLKPEEIETETQYLQEDLLDLSGMEHTRFEFLRANRHQVQVREGLRFETSPERVRPILRRLCARLDHTPQETLILIYSGQVRLQIQTHRAEELASIVASAEALLPPDSIFLAKAETYVRTRGELSPAEEANLDLLARQLGLTSEEAAALQAEAMGPFKTLADKQQRFSEILAIELAHDYPPSQETQQVLYEFAENLRLPQLEADRLYHQYLQKIQIDVEAQRQKQQAEAEAAQQKAAESQQQERNQQAQAEQEQRVDQYRDMFRSAIKNSFYPLAFDQGRLEQTRQIWGISDDVVRQIEEEIRSELFGSIQSSVDQDYSRLRQLLWSQSWQAADLETESVILKAFSKDMEPLDRDAAMRLPCLDLLTLDQLWSRYSNGKFGFQAQYQIFQQDADRRPQDFQQMIAWRNGSLNFQGELKPYKSLTFNLSAPGGHLPSWRWCCSSLEGGYDVSDSIIEGFFLHLEKCLSGNVALSPSSPWEGSSDT
jgi:hypothetical protein